MSVIHEKKIVVEGAGARPSHTEKRAFELTEEQKKEIEQLKQKNTVTYQNPVVDANKKTILFAITKANWGGAQKYVYDLALHFSKTHNVAVAFGKHEFTGKNIFREKLENLGVAIHPIEHMGKKPVLGDDLTACFELYKIIKLVKPDVLHLNSSKMAIYGGIAGRLGGVKNIVYTVHGYVFFDTQLKSHEKFILEQVTRFGLMFCHKIITISKLEESYTHKIANKTKVHLVHNGAHPIDFADPIEKMNSITRDATGRIVDLLRSQETTIIGSIAELRSNKGIVYLLQALKKLKESGKQFVYIHYGTGDQQKLIEAEIKQFGLQDHVLMKGFDKLASTYLPMFDIFTLPSLQEGTPYVLVEAGQAQCAVIATQVGGVPEMIDNQKTGILIPPKNVDALTEALETLMNDKDLRKQYGTALHEHITTTFNAERMYQETEAVYNA